MSEEPGNFKNRISELTQKLRTRMQSLTRRGASPSSEPGLTEGAPSGTSFFKNLGASIRHFDPAAASEWATGIFQNQANYGFYGKLFTILLCSYFVADLTAILAGKLLPEVQPSHARNAFGMHRSRTLQDYDVIMARNLFNSKGIIPGEEVFNPNGMDEGGTPVRTTLPFELIGTLILQDEQRSIATIADKSASQVYPVRIQDEIPGKAKILKIEAKKVIFVNETNHKREFVDLPDTPETAPKVAVSGRSNSGLGIEQVAANQFVISHTEVDKALADLNNILTQARAVPNFENGQPAGYKLFQIVPGSIYQKLGIQDGDVIVGFDGQNANDPAAAFEKLSNLKNASHMDLSIKRGGKLQSFSYDFR